MSPRAYTRHWLPRLDFLLQCAVETKPCGCKEPAAQRTCFAAVADVRADCFFLKVVKSSGHSCRTLACRECAQE